MVAGVPKIVGGVFGAGPTVSVNGASEVVALPSVTLIVTVDEVLASATSGVPLSKPVNVLNDAQLGCPEMLNVSASPSTSLAVGWNAYAWFTDAVVAGVPKIVGGVFGAGPTVSVNGASEVVALPSVTLIVTVDEVLASATSGVPLSKPVNVLNDAQLGCPEMLNVSASPSTSLAVGWNAYAWFTDAVVAGVPKIVGGVFGAGPTVSVNGASEVVALPSVTLIVTVDEVLASATSGVPLNRPVAVSNTAQLGGPWMLNVSASPSTSFAVGWNAYAWFTDAVVAGVPKIVGGVFGAGPTVSVNGASEVVALPSVTLIVTVDEVLASATSGVPLNRPVAVSNTAQLGGPWMLNVSASPSTSLAVGWNAYAWFTDAVVAGVPKIVGGVFGAGPTVSVNGASEVVALPSVTLIVTVDEVLASATVGVPLNRPVDVLNVAQVGFPVTLNVRVSPLTSLAVGWNAYGWFTGAEVAGVPEIVGAVLAGVTLMVKAASELDARPSETLITMLADVPTFAAPGVPLRRPFEVLNVAQAGLPVMLNVRGSPLASLAVGWNE